MPQARGSLGDWKLHHAHSSAAVTGILNKAVCTWTYSIELSVTIAYSTTCTCSCTHTNHSTLVKLYFFYSIASNCFSPRKHISNENVITSHFPRTTTYEDVLLVNWKPPLWPQKLHWPPLLAIQTHCTLIQRALPYLGHIPALSCLGLDFVLLQCTWTNMDH